MGKSLSHYKGYGGIYESVTDNQGMKGFEIIAYKVGKPFGILMHSGKIGCKEAEIHRHFKRLINNNVVTDEDS